MTPLARLITKQNALPVVEREYQDQDQVYRRMDDVHCFCVTDVRELVDDLACRLSEDGELLSELRFLPAPKTWIEWKQHGFRTGALLEQVGDAFCVDFAMSGPDRPGRYMAARPNFVIPVREGRLSVRMDERGQWSRDWCGRLALQLIAALAIINTPRIVGRRQHSPSRDLERRLLAVRGMVGTFPLRAWTEIVLEVTPPSEAGALDPGEAHLTGRRALHFCRQHLRIRGGRLELVKAHWRGDAAIGIKQSRYRVAA